MGLGIGTGAQPPRPRPSSPSLRPTKTRMKHASPLPGCWDLGRAVPPQSLGLPQASVPHSVPLLGTSLCPPGPECRPVCWGGPCHSLAPCDFLPPCHQGSLRDRAVGQEMGRRPLGWDSGQADQWGPQPGMGSGALARGGRLRVKETSQEPQSARRAARVRPLKRV